MYIFPSRRISTLVIGVFPPLVENQLPESSKSIWNGIVLTSFLSLSMTGMKTTIDAIREAGLRRSVKVLVGGAPLNERYATEIGADGYGATATDAVALARRQVGLAN